MTAQQTITRTLIATALLLTLFIGCSRTRETVTDTVNDLDDIRQSLSTENAPLIGTIAAEAAELRETAEAAATAGVPSTVAADVRERSQSAASTISAAATAGVPSTVAADVRDRSESAVGTVSAIATQGLIGTRLAESQARGQSLRGTSEALYGSLTTLQATILSALPDENGNMAVTVTSADIEAAIAARQADPETDEDEKLLQGVGIQINSDVIILTGDLTAPIRADFTSTFRPLVSDNKLQFDLQSASIGTVDVPAIALNSAEALLNGTINGALSLLPIAFELTDVILGDGTLTFIGSSQ